MDNLRETLLKAKEKAQERKQAIESRGVEVEINECKELAQCVNEFVAKLTYDLRDLLIRMVSRDFGYGVLYSFNVREGKQKKYNTKITSSTGASYDTEYIISGRFTRALAKHMPQDAVTVEERIQKYIENNMGLDGGVDPTTGNKYLVSCLWKKNPETSVIKNGVIVSRNNVKYSHYDKARVETHGDLSRNARDSNGTSADNTRTATITVQQEEGGDNVTYTVTASKTQRVVAPLAGPKAAVATSSTKK